MTKAIDAKNLTAQLQYRAAGNPPSTVVHAAVSNCYPGLEMDARNVWRRIFVGIELHEASNFVIGVDDNAPPELRALVNGYRLIEAGGDPIMVPVVGPEQPGGASGPLKDWSGDTSTAMEWSNALARIASQFAGQSVACTFQSVNDQSKVTYALQVRPMLDGALVTRDIAPAGALTQSLCSPWQYDYRQCACFYWAASRPDYVNVEPRPDGTSAGNNWIERDRTVRSPRVYINDDGQDPRLLTTKDLEDAWERSLRFVVRGVDEPPIAGKGAPKK